MPFQDQGQAQRRIYLGKITKAHGVKGLVKIQVAAEDHTLIETADAVYTGPHGLETINITLKNSDGQFWLGSVEGVNDRDKAEALNGTELYIERDQLPDIDTPGQYYLEDLKGLRVLEDDQEIGRIISVDNFGAGDLIDIQPLSGASFYIPFNPEFVLSVDLKEGTITVRNSDQMKVV